MSGTECSINISLKKKRKGKKGTKLWVMPSQTYATITGKTLCKEMKKQPVNFNIDKGRAIHIRQKKKIEIMLRAL